MREVRGSIRLELDEEDRRRLDALHQQTGRPRVAIVRDLIRSAEVGPPQVRPGRLVEPDRQAVTA